MNTLALKLSVTPLLILAASIASRTWGESIGGWLVGLPLTSAPVCFFLALDQGVGFAAGASLGCLTGAGAEAAFCLAYTAVARRGGGHRHWRQDRPHSLLPVSCSPLRRCRYGVWLRWSAPRWRPR